MMAIMVMTVETRHALSLLSSRPLPASLPPLPQSTDKLSPGQKRFRNPGKNNISSIIGSYKSVVSNNAHKSNQESCIFG